MDISDLSALLGEDAGHPTYSDIWVVLPFGADRMASAKALLGEARRLADALGCYVHVLIESVSAAPAVTALGADRVHVAVDPGPYLAQQRPEFVLLPARHHRLAAQLAQQLGGGLITDTPTIAIDGDTRALRGAHPVFDGDYLIELEVTTPVKLATVDTRGWPEPMHDLSRTSEVTVSQMPPLFDEKIWAGATAHTPPTWRPLQKARTIVSVGRGVGGEAGLAAAKRLAEKLGAEFAGDRSARDSGWIDEAHEVGVTGQEVAPKLYIALGILGDTIHNAAIAGAKRVIAVHPNPDAPIFKVADVCLVRDPAAILEKLLPQL